MKRRMDYTEDIFAALWNRSSKRRREHYGASKDESESEGSEDDSQWEGSDGCQSSGSQWEGLEEDESQSEGSEDASESEDSESGTGAWDSLGGHFYLGTSGWQFADWKTNVYPATVKKKDWFQEYSSHLNSVEENRSFQSIPSEASIQKLNEQANGLTRNWKMNPSDSPARLDAFLRAAKPKCAKWAMELRHESWLCESIYSVLRQHNVALCIHDNVDVEEHPQMLTADWTYVLFHGPRSESTNTWSEGYERKELQARANWIRKVLKQYKDVYAYFRNHNEGHAFHDALKLRARVLPLKESKSKKR
ncbi:hypothetical protein KFL_000440340 [Klebsormidium nitens]|uniref:Uncharacterized protein n=1 Tax=Klebsormidium nitens TaxID=105231 RepID=A0A1Y1HPP0_KLENI|nr:hypothetical protein KFL_000440340 [Klebsormidium nitens]|eukprot:GAQ80033.1 hypothetical protein KFL_000440340 [Klebsormidium nitens]